MSKRKSLCAGNWHEVSIEGVLLRERAYLDGASTHCMDVNICFFSVTPDAYLPAKAKCSARPVMHGRWCT